MCFRLLCAALVLIAAPAWGQPSVITGRVVDADDGMGLPGANVFISGTTRGTATAADGSFTLRTPLSGDIELVASVLGYDARARRLRLAPGDTLRVRLVLSETRLSLGEVEVEGWLSDEWRTHMEQFQAEFLGRTPNGRQAQFENAWVLDLERRGRVLSATSRAPLVIRNNALGYRMTLLDLLFEDDGSTLGWVSPVLFENLPSFTTPEVQAARLKAYNGSLRHFLTALVAGRTYEEGFEVRPAEVAGVVSRAEPLSSRDLARLLSADSTTASWRLVSVSPLQIRYAYESSERPGRLGEDQISWITIDDLFVDIDAQGRMLHSRPLTRYGYWDWERTADMLPSDYSPDGDSPS